MIMKERVSLRVSRLGMLLLALLAVAAVPVWAQRVVTVTPQEVKPVTVQVKPIVDVARVVDVVPQVVQSVQRIDVKPFDVAVVPVEVDYVAALQESTVPQEAQKLIEKFNEQTAATRKEADEKIAAQRLDLVKQLQTLQETYTKAGKLDEAIAIRAQLRRLENGSELSYRRVAARYPVVLDKSVNMEHFEVVPEHYTKALTNYSAWTAGYGSGLLHSLRNSPGATITLEVTGAEGNVWGTDIYTDDTPIAAAAVHAGLLKVGEKGWVKITIMPGRDSYTASDRNGIKSQSFGKFDGSYKIERGK